MLPPTAGLPDVREPWTARMKRVLLGRKRELHPQVFHKVSLIALLAWVGLGADGLSSSAYGPEEAFRTLGAHTYLAMALAVATAFTVLVISYAYSRIIEQFPLGGGGYVVASRLLGRRAGVVSGCALVVDYVLTISISIAAAGDAIFSFAPPLGLGLAGMLALFVRAYALGGGTYTGIEAVSNGLSIMREPKVQTGKRTMALMAVSLAVTAGGLILAYLLVHATPAPGRTMNAVLANRFAGGWPGIGVVFVLITLLSEALLLVVAGQAGFIDGPRVMANMAVDSYLPHRFSQLSDRLTMSYGVVLIGGASLLALLYTGGDVTHLVVLYSINVFLTFSLSELAMCRFWVRERKKHSTWRKHISVHVVGLTLCLFILTVTVYEKFGEGGWVTLALTGGLIAGCFLIRRHYRKVRESLQRLEP